ncbi:MAG: DUF4423 domain-containing protein, partial [Bdellovibrionales bacterium]|nr:DUF4423 domain-containing protein [Bdellovibrionales bacterium]
LLDLPPERENLFWASLALTHRTQPRERLSPFFKKMPVRAIPVQDLSGDWYRVVSDWYHYAILEMANLPAFNPDPSWIASQLGISPAESKLAIERLVRLDLLVRKDGKLSRSAGQMSTADQHLTNSALKRRQRQILEKSMASLENDPIETRNHTAMTMSIDPKRIPEAKALIREFNRRMSDLLESGDRTCVYEFAISLFPVLKNRGEV